MKWDRGGIRKIGICVQIGLQHNAEYLYLTRDDWRELNCDSRIPDLIAGGVGLWKYYGIDCNPHSIQYVTKTHHTGNWLTARIVPNPDYSFREAPILGFGVGKGWHRGVFSSCVTLSELFRGFHLCSVDVLAMDIEGSERDIFKHYDWTIRPCYMTIEIHSFNRNPKVFKDETVNAIIKGGYELISETPTNIDTPFPTVESCFIRKDLI